MQRHVWSNVGKPGEKLFDQEPVVDDDGVFEYRQPSGPLVGQIGVANRNESGLVAIPEDPLQLPSRPRRASGHDQRCIT